MVMTAEKVLNCWASATVTPHQEGEAPHGVTCLLEKGHSGSHEWTNDADILITFASEAAS